VISLLRKFPLSLIFLITITLLPSLSFNLLQQHYIVYGADRTGSKFCPTYTEVSYGNTAYLQSQGFMFIGEVHTPCAPRVESDGYKRHTKITGIGKKLNTPQDLNINLQCLPVCIPLFFMRIDCKAPPDRFLSDCKPNAKRLRSECVAIAH
jgi:hypothetical protein